MSHERILETGLLVALLMTTVLILTAIDRAHDRCVDRPSETLRAACAHAGGRDSFCARLLAE